MVSGVGVSRGGRRRLGPAPHRGGGGAHADVV